MRKILTRVGGFDPTDLQRKGPCEFNCNLLSRYKFKQPTQCSRHNSRVPGKSAQ